MNPEETDIDKFERYANNKMDTEEKHQFEDTLNKDESLRSEYDLFQSTRLIIETAEFGSQVREVINEKRKQPKAKARWIIPFSIAASIAILVTAYFLLFQKETAPGKLYVAYYEPFPNIMSYRASDQSNEEAMIFYDQMQFEQAVSSFESVKNPSDTLRFYWAISLLGNFQGNKALKTFEGISEESIFNQQISWYRGLSFLQIEEIDSARFVFKRIKPGEYKYKEAEIILSEL